MSRKEDRQAERNADPSQGFHVHQPTPAELEKDDGYEHLSVEELAEEAREEAKEEEESS